MLYFDSAYLVRLYYQDPGFDNVRELARTDTIACAQLGRAEVCAALHRKRQSGALTDSLYAIALKEFADNQRAGAFRWLALSPAVFDRLEIAFASLSDGVYLRAADGLHLACASVNGFREIHSNDRRLLDAAPHFGLKGVNVI